MTVLLSGYEKGTENLKFRVYAVELAETERRQAHRGAHFAALDLLGEALAADFGIRHAVLVREGLEKPYLRGKSPQMNLSHCKGLAVCAVGYVPLGIDAETPRRVSEKLMKTVCTAEECAEISAASDAGLAFSRVWTCKEAYTKFTGEGIRHPFAEISANAVPNVRLIQMLRGQRHAVTLCVPAGEYRLSAPAAGWEIAI